ncbi:type ISP restriction/modification enzyme, partial [Pseudomonas aeruginosa]
MPVNSVGIVTARDKLTIDYRREDLWKRIQDFALIDPETARKKYDLGNDASHWHVQWAQSDVNSNHDQSLLTSIAYRPFDFRWTYYTGTNQ